MSGEHACPLQRSRAFLTPSFTLLPLPLPLSQNDPGSVSAPNGLPFPTTLLKANISCQSAAGPLKQNLLRKWYMCVCVGVCCVCGSGCVWVCVGVCCVCVVWVWVCVVCVCVWVCVGVCCVCVGVCCVCVGVCCVCVWVCVMCVGCVLCVCVWVCVCVVLCCMCCMCCVLCVLRLCVLCGCVCCGCGGVHIQYMYVFVCTFPHVWNLEPHPLTTCILSPTH